MKFSGKKVNTWTNIRNGIIIISIYNSTYYFLLNFCNLSNRCTKNYKSANGYIIYNDVICDNNNIKWGDVAVKVVLVYN